MSRSNLGALTHTQAAQPTRVINETQPHITLRAPIATPLIEQARQKILPGRCGAATSRPAYATVQGKDKVNRVSLAPKLNDSLVINTHARMSFVRSIIGNRNMKLLFRASRDGWDNTEFHKRCDKKGPSITLFKTLEGRICGGYTTVGWENNYQTYKSDSQCFVFSVDNK